MADERRPKSDLTDISDVLAALFEDEDDDYDWGDEEFPVERAETGGNNPGGNGAALPSADPSRTRAAVEGSAQARGWPLWVSCSHCDGYWCNLHEVHAHDCPCPHIDDLGFDPYSEGVLVVGGKAVEEFPGGCGQGGRGPDRVSEEPAWSAGGDEVDPNERLAEAERTAAIERISRETLRRATRKQVVGAITVGLIILLVGFLGASVDRAFFR